MSAAVRTIAEFNAHDGLKTRLRNAARDLAIRALALKVRPQAGAEWIRFPFWHHVFDDERRDFARQLTWMKRHGDVIGYDEAVSLLASGQRIGGRYFCLSFDDGFRNVATNGLPILKEQDVSALIFLATSYIGSDLEKDRKRLLGFYPERPLLMEFLSWDEAAHWLAAGMSIGSHTAAHAHLVDLDEAAARAEFVHSKQAIEEKLGITCHHFGCPWGHPGSDFVPERDPNLAKETGYASFATTERGTNHPGGSVFALKRDHLLAKWGDHQLRYFLLGDG